jgi:hypothetical protein
VLFGSKSIGPLDAGASFLPSASFSLPAGTPLGTYYVIACSDDLIRIVELDEQADP